MACNDPCCRDAIAVELGAINNADSGLQGHKKVRISRFLYACVCESIHGVEHSHNPVWPSYVCVNTCMFCLRP